MMTLFFVQRRGLRGIKWRFLDDAICERPLTHNVIACLMFIIYIIIIQIFLN